jgi:hypothetical protein
VILVVMMGDPVLVIVFSKVLAPAVSEVSAGVFICGVFTPRPSAGAFQLVWVRLGQHVER